MASNRTFGQEISGNRQRNGELSSEMRAAILTKLDGGQKPGKIATELGISRHTVYYTKKRWAQHRTLDLMPRSGRPQKLTPSEKRYLYLLLRRNPRMAYKAIPESLHRSISRRTIRRAMRAIGLRKWKSAGRIPLKKKDVRERLKFARFWKGKRALLEVKILF